MANKPKKLTSFTARAIEVANDTELKYKFPKTNDG
jgi:hypothetical protein